MEPKKIRFMNRSGQSRRIVDAKMQYTDDGFKIDYEQMREERAVDEKGVAIIKKIKTAKSETAKFKDIERITKMIPYGSFAFSAIVILALIFVLCIQTNFEWYMILLAIIIPLLVIYDVYKEIIQLKMSYLIYFNNQVAYVVRFKTATDAKEFQAKINLDDEQTE